MHTPLFLYVFLSRHPIDGSTVHLARDGYPVPMPWGCPCVGEAAGVAGSGLRPGRAGRVQGIERVLERRTDGERRRR